MLSVTSAQLESWLALLLWPLSRVLGLITAAPILGNMRVPVRTRVGLAICITLVVAPTLPPMPQVSPASASGLMIVATQFLLGVAMGYTVRLVFHAVEMAGELIGVQMGLGFAQLYDPQNHAQVTVLSQFLALLATLTFLAMDGHLLIVRALGESFHAMPVAAGLPPGGWSRLCAEWGTMTLRAALLISLPVVTVLLVTNLALGILTRAAPQLNMFAVGFPLTLAVGLLALWTSLPTVLSQVTQITTQAINVIPAIWQ